MPISPPVSENKLNYVHKRIVSLETAEEENNHQTKMK